MSQHGRVTGGRSHVEPVAHQRRQSSARCAVGRNPEPIQDHVQHGGDRDQQPQGLLTAHDDVHGAEEESTEEKDERGRKYDDRGGSRGKRPAEQQRHREAGQGGEDTRDSNPEDREVSKAQATRALEGLRILFVVPRKQREQGTQGRHRKDQKRLCEPHRGRIVPQDGVPAHVLQHDLVDALDQQGRDHDQGKGPRLLDQVFPLSRVDPPLRAEAPPRVVGLRKRLERPGQDNHSENHREAVPG